MSTRCISLLGRLRKRKGRVRHGTPRIGLGFERLEPREVLSTIVWVNRGDAASDSDSFNAIFGPGAETAREVVDAVIDAWESAIGSFNYSDPALEDTYQLTVSMGTSSQGAVSAQTGGKPTAGWLTLDRAAGWFIDPTPYHHEEFLGTLVNPYVAAPTPGGPADGLSDFYSFVMAEMAHCMGLDASSNLLFQQDPSGYFTNTGMPDQEPSPPIGTLWTFNGPSIQALFTSNNLGTMDVGVPIHVAEAVPGNVFTSPGGITYYGVEDTGLAGGDSSWRVLVSNLITQVFKDSYGYTINPPTWNNLHTVLDPATGVLRVRGGTQGMAVYPQQLDPGDDTIRINSFSSLGADYLRVDVFVGNPVPGIGPNVTLSSTFLASEVSSIVIDAGDGDDSIVIQTPDAAVTVTVNAGEGDDEILIYADDLGDVVTVDAGNDADTLTVAGTDRDDFFLLRRSAADAGLRELFINGLTLINLRNIDTLVASGGPLFGEGNDELMVDFRNGNPLAATHLNFLGGIGDDVMRFTRSSFAGSDLFSASFVGETGTDRIEATVTGGADLDLTDDLLEWNDVDRPSVLGSQVMLSGVEESILIGGSGDNVFDASGFTAGRVTLRGEGGDDHLIGGPNDDTLDGGPGNDTMDGGGGNDTYLEAPGSLDQLIDSGGVDTLDFSAATSGIALDLTRTAGQVQTVDLAGNQIALTGFFERLIGSAFDDRFFWGHTVAGQSILEMLAGAGDDQVIIDGTKATPGTAVSLVGGQGDDRFQIHLPLPGAGGNPPPNPPGDKGVLLSAIVDGERLHIVGTDQAEDIRVVGRLDQAQTPHFDVGISDPVSQRLLAQITAQNVAHFALDAAAGKDRIRALLESAGLIAVPLVANLGGGADDDQLFIDMQNSVGSFAWSVMADGGAGDDFLQTLGLTGAILLGGKGIDEVIGGNGRDLLIGGEDRDGVTGGKGEDILIPGLTAFDANPDALRWIHAFWNSDVPFLERVEFLSGPSDAQFHLVLGESVFDDGADNNVSDHSLDDWLLSPCFVTNTNDSGPGSLREAIECANMAALPALAVIDFRIPTTDLNFVDVDSHLPGGDPDPDAFVISPLSELPPLDNVHGFGITLDGGTQTSFGGDTNPFGPEIVLVNGGGITEPPVAIGLWLLSDDNRVSALNIQGFVDYGIVVMGSRNWVAGNYIGTDPTGRVGRGNGNGIILAGTATLGDREENLIGTDGDGMEDEAERNVISGNSSFGVFITESYSVVAGNYIGTDATGRTRLPNAAEGVRIVGGAYNRIGTDGNGVADEAERNIISGNGEDGVGLYRTVGNVVAGNYIGTDTNGSIALGNGENGVIVSSAEPSFTSEDNIIGTDGDGISDAAERNIIAGNSLSGVYIERRNTFQNVVAGNYIGTNVTGTQPLANGEHGVLIIEGAHTNIIGTNGDGVADGAEGNFISANAANGVHIEGAGTDQNVVAGNHIGTDVSGAVPLGNTGFGVLIINGADANRIGTNGDGLADEAERNLISGNGTRGISIAFGSDRNVVAGNFIGTEVTGRAALPNGSGVFIGSGSQANMLGTNGDGVADEAERNVISGNLREGVIISTRFGRDTTANVVAGNYIGTDATGTATLGNGGHGVSILGAARNNRVGTNADGLADAAERNIISANILNGVHIEGADTDGNVVAGNYIGTDATGMLPLGNRVDGVRIIEFAGQNIIGGIRPGAGNVISANGNEGIRIQNAATANRVEGNYIGTDFSGTKPLGNLSDGVAIVEAHANTVGGAAAGAGNLISSNTLNGVALQGSASTGNEVLGNLIGADVTGRLPLGNSNYGVSINVASNNVIGGAAPAARNVISGNRAGVFIGSDVLAGESVGNQVTGNFIGVNISGLAPLGNRLDGVNIFHRARNNVVDSNVVSGNREDGIVILGPDATANEVSRNYVGVDVTGGAAIANGQSGVLITGSAAFNQVQSNVLSGNVVAGLDLFAGASNNTVTGNFVGLNAAGTAAIPNTYGVSVQYGADRNIIGTNADGVNDDKEGNVVSGNHTVGVLLHGASHNVVAGNTIGLDAAGADPLPNNGPGVWIIPSDFGGVAVVAEGNRIGYQSQAVERNVIAANRGDGVRISAAHPETGEFIGARNNIVAGNNITMNAGHGVHIFGGAVSNRIGTDGASVAADSVEGNLISGNMLDGVRVVGVETVRNTIRGNSIHSNGLLGIDLGGDGVTDNDARDPDTGPNQLQNYPVLAAALAEGTGTRVRGTLKSLSNTSFTIDFYANAAADPSGHGEGQRWLGAIMVTTNAGGTATINHLLDISVEPGQLITATATDGPAANLGNTSEFSATRLVIKPGGRAPGPQVAFSAPEENNKHATPGNARAMNRIDQRSVLAQAADHLFGWDHAADGVMAETLSLVTLPALGGDADTSTFAVDALFALLAADEEPAWIDSNPFRRGRLKFA